MADHHIPFEIIPGIASPFGVSAYTGIPLTHRELASSVTFVTGHEDPEKESSSIAWDHLVGTGKTLVFLMVVQNLSKITQKLIQAGLNPNTPAAVIQEGTLPDQKIVMGSIKNIDQQADQQHIQSPAVLIVGEVVRFHSKLNWFANNPLFTKKILLTRIPEQSQDIRYLFYQYGACPYEFPVIQLVEPDEPQKVQSIIKAHTTYDWIIFTSANGVKYFDKFLQQHNSSLKTFLSCKIAAIGSKTSQAILERGSVVHCQPAQFVAEALLNELASYGSFQNKKVLILRAEEAREILVDTLRQWGAVVDDIAVYKTVLDQTADENIISMLKKDTVDWVTFTSSSTVKNFVIKLEQLGIPWPKKIKIASIGPITSQTIRELGRKVDVEADPSTIEGLVQAIYQWEETKHSDIL